MSNYPEGTYSSDLPGFEDQPKTLNFECYGCGKSFEDECIVNTKRGAETEIRVNCPQCGGMVIYVYVGGEG